MVPTSTHEPNCVVALSTLDIVPGERIINSYVLAAAGERFSVSLCTVEFLPDGIGTLLRLTEHGAYFDGNPEGPQMRVHGMQHVRPAARPLAQPSCKSRCC